jgi:hypothetical protein
VPLMKRKTSAVVEQKPLTREDYSVRYWVSSKSTYDWKYEDIEYSEAAAMRTAKKYVHLGPVKITEKLERTIAVLPEVPICT